MYTASRAMAKSTASRPDPMEQAVEAALLPGQFVRYGAGWTFVQGLEDVASRIESLVGTASARAVALFETFLAGCYEKAEEIDDSDGRLGMFVERLYCGWIKARQAAGMDRDETAKFLLARMDDDPYGFSSHIERDAVKAFDKDGLAAFEGHVRARFDAAAGAAAGDKEREYTRRRWADVLRAVYAAQRSLEKYVALCEATALSPGDCETVARLLQGRRRPADALAWAERGLDLKAKAGLGAGGGYELAGMKRTLLKQLGRGDEARDSAWAEFQEAPSTFAYEELMRHVPRARRAEWREKALAASERGNLGSVIELWLKLNEIDRLVDRLRRATDEELEQQGHSATTPAAERLAESHPDVAAKVFRALGMRIVNAKKSKYYDAALSNLERAQRCYTKAGLDAEWTAFVAEVRADHHRKGGFMPGFERLVAGRGPSTVPSFLERARRRWSRGNET
jgi:uncharacterized protein DUF6880